MLEFIQTNPILAPTVFVIMGILLAGVLLLVLPANGGYDESFFPSN